LRFMTGTSIDPDSSSVVFLERLQLVLSESLTSSTYKYALVLALADICVEQDSDLRSELTVPITQLAEKFLAMYWRHGSPYGVGLRDSGGGVLLQNRGQQAAVIVQAAGLRSRFRTLAAAKRDPSWGAQLRQLAQRLDAMPLWRLQKLRTTTLDFLYPENPGGTSIVLRPGVAHHFRRFYALIVRLVQAEWMAFLYALPANRPVLGNSGDLADFLFGPQRESLLAVRDPLVELQSGLCFYCERNLTSPPEVDHFIPWSRYPRNLMHNLVAAHRSCNAQKSDILPSIGFHDRWQDHIANRDGDLQTIAENAGILADRGTAIHVANWCYDEARRIGAEVWLGGENFERLGPLPG
jgi:hypothetical protein